MAAEAPAPAAAAAAAAAPAVDAEGKNASPVFCKFCGSKVLLAGVAAFVERAISLPKFESRDEASGEELRTHWRLTRRFDFENVGVTRPVSAESAQRYRYLTCADCERGPIGIVFFLETRQEEYFVSHGRVAYALPAKEVPSKS